MVERMVPEFQIWWSRYPLKVAKFAAIKAYVKARTQASADELLSGVEQYRVSKPAWQEWAHPATWLNAGRWLDEAPTRVKAVGLDGGPSQRDLELIAEHERVSRERRGDA